MAYDLKNVVVSSKKPSICFVGVINQTSSYGNTPLLPLKKQHWQCVNGPASSPHCLLKTVKWGFAFTSLFQRPTGVSANILQKTSHSFLFCFVCCSLHFAISAFRGVWAVARSRNKVVRLAGRVCLCLSVLSLCAGTTQISRVKRFCTACECGVLGNPVWGKR